jgi:hypothetical protein
MASILEIALRGPWEFAGTVILIFVTAAMIEYIVRGRKK